MSTSFLDVFWRFQRKNIWIGIWSARQSLIWGQEKLNLEHFSFISMKNESSFKKRRKPRAQCSQKWKKNVQYTKYYILNKRIWYYGRFWLTSSIVDKFTIAWSLFWSMCYYNLWSQIVLNCCFGNGKRPFLFIVPSNMIYLKSKVNGSISPKTPNQ